MKTAVGQPPISQRPPVGKVELWWECLRKWRYSRVEATRKVDWHNRYLRTGERDYHAYRCDHCQQYHIGHVPQGSL